MINREKLKKEIDKIPDELLEQLERFIKTIKYKQRRKKTLHTFHLSGKYDDIKIREEAYE